MILVSARMERKKGSDFRQELLTRIPRMIPYFAAQWS